MSDFYVSLEVATEMVKSAVLAEREACAVAAEKWYEGGRYAGSSLHAADVIRARSDPS